MRRSLGFPVRRPLSKVMLVRLNAEPGVRVNSKKFPSVMASAIATEVLAELLPRPAPAIERDWAPPVGLVLEEYESPVAALAPNEMAEAVTPETVVLFASSPPVVSKL